MIDEISLEILRILQEKARISHRERNPMRLSSFLGSLRVKRPVHQSAS